MQILPIRKTDGKWARNNEQKAQRFAEHLEHTFQLQGNQEENEMITEGIVQENEDIKLVTATEVKNEINNNINPKKSTGIWSHNRRSSTTATEESYSKNRQPYQCCFYAKICTQTVESGGSYNDTKARETTAWACII